MSKGPVARPSGVVRVGLIGCGTVARLHVEKLAADPRVRIAAFLDPRREAAERLRTEFAPGAEIFSDNRALALEASLDAVVISSPTLDHHQHVIRAFDAGWHVLCEKPLAADRAQIVDLIERGRERKLTLAVAYQRRYKSIYRTARRELLERPERYGRTREIHIFTCEHWAQTIGGTWRDDPAIGAGYFGDAGSHQIDIASFVTGLRPHRVLAASDKRDAQVEIVTRILATYEGDVGLSAHYVGDAHHWREDIHFHGERGDLLLRGGEIFRCQGNRVEPVTDLLPETSPDQALVDAILLGTPVASPGECALPMYDWTQGVLDSIRTGGWVDLPLPAVRTE